MLRSSRAEVAKRKPKGDRHAELIQFDIPQECASENKAKPKRHTDHVLNYGRSPIHASLRNTTLAVLSRPSEFNLLCFPVAVFYLASRLTPTPRARTHIAPTTGKRARC